VVSVAAAGGGVVDAPPDGDDAREFEEQDVDAIATTTIPATTNDFRPMITS
jgi:hypothetical protein